MGRDEPTTMGQYAPWSEMGDEPDHPVYDPTKIGSEEERARVREQLDTLLEKDDSRKARLEPAIRPNRRKTRPVVWTEEEIEDAMREFGCTRDLALRILQTT